jgi:hypothetical protein
MAPMKKLVTLGLAMALSSVACGPRDTGDERAPDGELALEVTAELRSLWWNDEELAQRNAEPPPPKTTEVVLDRWDAGDPTVPSPQAVDLRVRVENRSTVPGADLLLMAATRWKGGPINDPSRAAWSAAESLPGGPIPLVVPASLHREHRFTGLELQAAIERLSDEGLWPWQMEVQLRVVRAQQPHRTLAETRVRLPMQPAAKGPEATGSSAPVGSP